MKSTNNTSALTARAIAALPEQPKGTRVQIRPRLCEVDRAFRDVRVDGHDGRIAIVWRFGRDQRGRQIARASDDGTTPRFELRDPDGRVVVA